MKKEAGSSTGRRPRARADRAPQSARTPAWDFAGRDERVARCRENILPRCGIVFPSQEPPFLYFLVPSEVHQGWTKSIIQVQPYASDVPLSIKKKAHFCMKLGTCTACSRVSLSDVFFTFAVPFANKPRLSFEVVLPLWRHKGPHPQPVPLLSPLLFSAESSSTSSLHARAQRAERGQHSCEQRQPSEPQRPPVHWGRARKQPSTII